LWNNTSSVDPTGAVFMPYTCQFCLEEFRG
jgi:hypothetical protein